jgi:hypothetical protein
VLRVFVERLLFALILIRSDAMTAPVAVVNFRN